MEKSEIKNFPLFREVMNFLGNFLDEMEIQCKGHDIIIEGNDPSRITMMTLELKDILKEPINIVFALNVDHLNKILDKIEDTPVMVEKSTKDNKKGYLKLSSNGESYTLSLLDVELEDIPFVNLRKIEYEKKIEVEREKLLKIIETARIYSEIIHIRFDSKGIEYYAVGQLGEFTKTEGLVEKQGETEYSLSFLKAVVKNTEALFVKPLTLHIKTDYPLHIEYIDTGIEYHQWLAPRVDEPDFDDDDMDDF